MKSSPVTLISFPLLAPPLVLQQKSQVVVFAFSVARLQENMKMNIKSLNSLLLHLTVPTRFLFVNMPSLVFANLKSLLSETIKKLVRLNGLAGTPAGLLEVCAVAKNLILRTLLVTPSTLSLPSVSNSVSSALSQVFQTPAKPENILFWMLIRLLLVKLLTSTTVFQKNVAPELISSVSNSLKVALLIKSFLSLRLLSSLIISNIGLDLIIIILSLISNIHKLIQRQKTKTLAYQFVFLTIILKKEL